MSKLIDTYPPTAVTGALYRELQAIRAAGTLPRAVTLTRAQYDLLTAESEGNEQHSFCGIPIEVDGERVKSPQELFYEAMQQAAAEGAEDSFGSPSLPVLN